MKTSPPERLMTTAEYYFDDVFRKCTKPVKVLSHLNIKEREELAEILVNWLNGFRYFSMNMREVLAEVRDQFSDVWNLISNRINPDILDKINQIQSSRNDS